MDHREPDCGIVNLLTQIQVPLRLYVRSLLPSEAAARDVAQNANKTIWEKRDTFVPGTNFKAWAFSIARYEVLNFRKAQARDARLTFSDSMEQTFAAELAARQDDTDARHYALRRCLSKLRQKDKDLLMHRYASGDNLQQYADRTGRSVNGLKVTLHRLRNALMECIRRQLEIAQTNA